MAGSRVHRAATVDAEDVAKFDRLGAEWWASDGPMRALHKFNPVRVDYLRDLLVRHFARTGGQAPPPARPLDGLSLLDIGCGGGILSEPLAEFGAAMTAIDPAPGNIEIARRHAETTGRAIDYRCTTAEELGATGAAFDAVLAMEVVEHVRDVRGFLRTAASMVRPGGLIVVATLNRTFKSYALAIVGAEYVLRWVPRGTHDWHRFVTPHELATALRSSRFSVTDRVGVTYDLRADAWRLSRDMDVNYMLAAARAA